MDGLGSDANQRFYLTKTGYTRATGPDYAFQADTYHRTFAATTSQDPCLDPAVMHLQSEYQDRYNRGTNQLNDYTVRRIYTNPQSGVPRGDFTLNSGEAWGESTFSGVKPYANTVVPPNADAPETLVRKPLGDATGEVPRTESNGAHTTIGGVRTLNGTTVLGGYKSIDEMASAGSCDKKLCETIQPASTGNGGMFYKNLNAYLPGYSAYRRPWPGNYSQGLQGTAPTEASVRTAFIDNCKFETQPHMNDVNRECDERFLTTHKTSFKAIREPDYGTLNMTRNPRHGGSFGGTRSMEGMVDRKGTTLGGTFSGHVEKGVPQPPLKEWATMRSTGTATYAKATLGKM